MKGKGILAGLGLLGLLAFLTYAYVWERSDYVQPKLELAGNTSISPAVYQEKDFIVELKSDFAHLFQDLEKGHLNHYVIPGLVQSDSLHITGSKKGQPSIAKDMDPQGMAIMEDYVVVSAYSKSKKHHSVLWLLDKKNQSFVKTIVLPDKSHVGGITYDHQAKNLWLTVLDKDKDAAIASIAYDKLLAYDFEVEKSPISYDNLEGLKGIKLASYMTYYQNTLYIGYFDKDKNGVLGAYPLTAEGYLDETVEIENHVLPSKTYPTFEQIQGIAINDEMIILSQSFGSKNSKLLFFKNQGVDKWTDFDQGDSYADMIAPPYMEQIVLDDGLYMIFESASAKYRQNKSILNMDRIIRLTEDSLPR